jgi:GT2 family glycosyltransferase/tetratricopeptide (TPR) repeat protein/2-polyprenyl-3-methyl-5-hydroxy-6-metoxy-1,4-benzoquinol methylase
MDIRRVALIFDDRERPETTGVYCRRALERLVAVEHFRPDEIERISGTNFDLYLNIDDGFPYRLPAGLHPSAFWAIDTHLDFDRCGQKARGFDLVFAAQRDGAERLVTEGIAPAIWLPLACDPELHRKHDVAKRYDVAFVGNIFPGPRAELLNLIRWRYPDSFIGQCYFDEMARTYSAARIGFNRGIKNDLNMRVFEVLACGSMLVTNDLKENGLAELFQEGVHLATYQGPEELLEKLDYYLRREEVRDSIAAAGRSEALHKHTYRHRMERLLREVEHALARKVVPIAVQPQWGHGSTQDPFYFGYARPEILALVPTTARRVLDIGCGSGRLGEALKSRQQVEVVGIELNETAAHQARERLDHVHCGDVEAISLPFTPGTFDTIVCGDILEHLREPERLLRRASEWLTPDGRIVASIPNVRHRSVVCSLLQGNWTYESAGLLDQTHLRFFTRREIEKLFFRTGFAIEEMWSVNAPGDQGASPKEAGPVQLGRLCIDGLSEQDAAEFYTYQYLVRARICEPPNRGLTSIIIVTHNQLEYTRQCLDSVRRLTDEPYELIVVDNASTDGTREYLSAMPGLHLIPNDTNRGFPAAVNQGITSSKGDQILLLNNDTVVSTGWLCRLLRALHGDRSIGLVGPCSNFVSGPQQIQVGYENVGEMDGFAWDWGKAHDGLRIETNRLVGFCLLIRREFVDAVGLLDERFGIGCFEDDDYCLRAARAGYRAMIAGDAFVHHYGGRTFLGSGVDVGRLMSENQQRFHDKWSTARNGDVQAGEPETRHLREPGDAGGSPDGFAVEFVPGSGLRLRRASARPLLSLCMIVRDSARTLRPCLESIRPWVDEMVIVDTGSADETPRIVEEFGGRLFHFPWCDDFSAARNESLRHAQGEWLFWMDSDDTIPPACGRGLRRLVGNKVAPGVLGFVMQVQCPGGGADSDPEFDITVVDHVKVFRNRPDLRFDGRIHEQVLPAIRSAGGEVAWTDLHVVHSGSDQGPPAREKKLKRDLHLLQLELAERPEHPFTLFNLGMTHVHGFRYADAADFLQRGIARSNAGESHLRKAYALLVYAQMRLGKRQEALATCRQGRSLYPHDAELRFREGVVLHELGRLDEAKQAYRDVLRNGEERHFASVDRALTGFKAHQNLAVIARDQGDLVDAAREWREVVLAAPQYRVGWRGLGDTLVCAGHFAEAEALANELLSNTPVCLEGLLLRSRIGIARGNLADARTALDQALTEKPDDLEVLRCRCQFLFEHGEPDEAERALKALIDRDGEDAAAHHNLGTLLLRTGRYDEAAQAFRQSLRFRSSESSTYLNLGYALKESGRLQEAVKAWEQALRLSPSDPAARQEMIRLGIPS